ncbi:hypothetical protein GCM10009634_58170 [Saccharothrix xinjiangensis]
MPQFALTGALVDLGPYGFGGFESDYTPSTWNSVRVGDGLFGLPQDSGPMALFYNRSVWDQLVENRLVAEIPGWTDAWYRALGDGTIASLAVGAWMPGVLEASVPGGAGKWAVAPLPAHDGTPVTAENGGSTQSVLRQSANPALAAAFVRARLAELTGRWLDGPTRGGITGHLARHHDTGTVNRQVLHSSLRVVLHSGYESAGRLLGSALPACLDTPGSLDNPHRRRHRHRPRLPTRSGRPG